MPHQVERIAPDAAVPVVAPETAFRPGDRDDEPAVRIEPPLAPAAIGRRTADQLDCQRLDALGQYGGDV